MFARNKNEFESGTMKFAKAVAQNECDYWGSEDRKFKNLKYIATYHAENTDKYIIVWEADYIYNQGLLDVNDNWMEIELYVRKIDFGKFILEDSFAGGIDEIDHRFLKETLDIEYSDIKYVRIDLNK